MHRDLCAVCAVMQAGRNKAGRPAYSSPTRRRQIESHSVRFKNVIALNRKGGPLDRPCYRLGTDLLVRPFYILCFAEMCFAGALAYATLRADAMALAGALDWDPTPRLW